MRKNDQDRDVKKDFIRLSGVYNIFCYVKFYCDVEIDFTIEVGDLIGMYEQLRAEDLGYV